MPQVVRRVRIERPVGTVFAACVDLMRTADPSRGVVARRVEPDPPAVDAVVHTTVRDKRGERELRATVVALQPPHELSTVTDGAPAVRTTLRCRAEGDGATLVTLESDAEGTLSHFGRGGALLDAMLFRRGQRSAARATLRRLRELATREQS
jgi:Polyketide cyclase / dehydrase and lipid transport